MTFKETFFHIVYYLKEQIIGFSIASYQRFLELLYGPLQQRDMWWILGPLLANIFIMEFYFGRYKKEELGWNTAFGNSIVLLFVSVDLVRYLYNHELLFFNFKTILVGVIIFVGIILTVFDYFHGLPEQLAFAMSSKLPINFLALMGILMVYTNIPLDKGTYGAFFMLLLVVWIIIKVIHLIIPWSKEEQKKNTILKKETTEEV